jgi:perosamine synthetase
MSSFETFTSDLFALKEPTLYPTMLAGRPGRRSDVFPFSHPSVRYYYLGRNASYALVKALGLVGQEILFPAFFGNPVLQAPLAAGARVRFYPVRSSLSVDPNDIRSSLTPETRAIYVIHYAGFPAPIDEIMQIARERELVVIEDAAHALCSSHNGRQLGTFGDGAFFSFYKWVPVPNGAAAVINRGNSVLASEGTRPTRTSEISLASFSLLDNIAVRAGAPGRAVRSGFRALGRRVAHTGSLTYLGTGSVQFSHHELGYEMSPLAHRIMRTQDLDWIAECRRRNFSLLAELLGEVAPPMQGRLPEGVTPLFYATRVTDKRSVLGRLRARGVEGRNFWELFHPLLPEGVFPETDELRRTTLELPIHQDLSAEKMERIACAVRDVIESESRSAFFSRRPGHRLSAAD